MDFLQIKDEVLIPGDGQIMACYTVHLFWISFSMRNGRIDPRVVICNIYCYIIQESHALYGKNSSERSSERLSLI